jgi:type IV pilus assembly protein PilM
MIFNRKSLGVEITPSGVAFALLAGPAASPRLERVSYRPLEPGTVRLSVREPNILDPQAFAARLKDAYNTLLYGGTRLSVTLPDSVGRIMLLDIEGHFKSRAEGLDVIRWKLKKSMPFDVSDSHLDYQQLRVRENGDSVMLVALVSRTVMGQYEELLSEAGFVPARIDFNIFNLCRTFEQRLALSEDCALVSFYDGILGIMIFFNGLPEFVRIKDLSGATVIDTRVYMEINSSFLVYRERFPDRSPQQLFCIAPPHMAHDFCGAVTEVAGSAPILLETKSALIPSDAAPADQDSLFPFTASVGAALRSL